MLESDRAQTAIVVILMIGAGVSGASLYAISSFYANTYALIGSIDVSISSIEITGFNPSGNISLQTPNITITIRITTGPFSGDVVLRDIKTILDLNNETLLYPKFERGFPSDYSTLVANYDTEIPIKRSLLQDTDKLNLVYASGNSTWQWSAYVRIRYYSFTTSGTNAQGEVIYPALPFDGVEIE
jgi:hypothetical protein